MKKEITTPIKNEDIAGLRIGDIVYLTGYLVTCRDDGHRRVIEEGILPKFDLENMAILHAGPIVKKNNDSWDMVSIGPTTSKRMEKYESEFIEKTKIKFIIGKGGMGEKTAQACKKYKAIHTMYPGGCAVVAAEEVEKIEGVEWEEFGMPEAFWIMKVKKFGPLVVTIDTEGSNLFEKNKEVFQKTKKEEMKKMSKFISDYKA